MGRIRGMNRAATCLASLRAFKAQTTLSKLIQCALMSSALVAGPASAALFDIVVTTDMLSGDFVSGTDTLFGVTPVDLTERVEEIARMLGGIQITETTISHVREMLKF